MKNPSTSALCQRIQPYLAGLLATPALLLAAAGTARSQTPASFAIVSTYSTGANSNPLGGVVADMNGDGRPDIVTANTYSSTAGVLLGQAGGSFAAVSTYSTGVNSEPYAVAVADVNGDSRPDIVTANFSSQAVGVLLGQASGGFAAVSQYSAGGSPYDVAVADVNGDGRPDLVTANYNGSAAGVLLGQASGGFAAVSTYSAGANPFGVAVAAVNGDGRADIVMTNVFTDTAGVLLGRTGGGFAAVSTYPTGSNSYPTGVVVADVSGDGRPDIVTANLNSNTVGVLLGGIGGGFAAVTTYPTGANSGPRDVVVADVNGDGRADIVTANRSNDTAGVLLGRAGGGFAAVSTFAAGGFFPQAVAVADVNGDGRPDIVTAHNGVSTAGVLLNTGTFAPLAAARAAAAAEDAALFPNPARGGFAVRLPAAWGAASVRAELRNALGQVVATRTVVLPAGAALNFATDGLAPGVYVLRVQASGHTLARRVVLD